MSLTRQYMDWFLPLGQLRAKVECNHLIVCVCVLAQGYSTSVQHVMFIKHLLTSENFSLDGPNHYI